MVSRTHVNVTSHVHCLSCYKFFRVCKYRCPDNSQLLAQEMLRKADSFVSSELTFAKIWTKDIILKSTVVHSVTLAYRTNDKKSLELSVRRHTCVSVLLLSLDVKIANVFQKNTGCFNEHWKIYPWLSRFTIDHYRDIVSERFTLCILHVDIWCSNRIIIDARLFLRPQLLSHFKQSVSERPIAADHKHRQVFAQSVWHFCPILTKIGMYRQMLVTIPETVKPVLNEPG